MMSVILAQHLKTMISIDKTRGGAKLSHTWVTLYQKVQKFKKCPTSCQVKKISYIYSL